MQAGRGAHRCERALVLNGDLAGLGAVGQQVGDALPNGAGLGAVEGLDGAAVHLHVQVDLRIGGACRGRRGWAVRKSLEGFFPQVLQDEDSWQVSAKQVFHKYCSAD